MVRLKLWQWSVLGLPIAGIVGFLLIASGVQIHTWGLSWVWAIFTVMLVGWRFLLVKWTRPTVDPLEIIMAVKQELEAATDSTSSLTGGIDQQTEAALQQILEAVQSDPPMWEDWATFWRRCQELVTAIAQVYHPEVKTTAAEYLYPSSLHLDSGHCGRYGSMDGQALSRLEPGDRWASSGRLRDLSQARTLSA